VDQGPPDRARRHDRGQAVIENSAYSATGRRECEIALAYDYDLEKDFLSLFAERGLEPLIRHRSTGFETVRALVAAGEGFAVLNQKPSHDTTYTGQPVVTTRKAAAFMRLCVESYATSSHR